MQSLREHFLEGQAIPAQPLALDANRKFDEKYQRALTRYYVAAGSGGLAVGVHSTQFQIREPQHALLKPVLELASETIDNEIGKLPRAFVKVAGVCGNTQQADGEATLARAYGYQAGLLSLAALKNASDDELIAHCETISHTIPIIGFYMQPSVGGRALSYEFWRRFAEIPNVVAIKIAPFNRYQTIDVVRAVIESGRDDIALYTGNDDSIVVDLFTTWQFARGNEIINRQIVGGLLGHWAVWTQKAVALLNEIKIVRNQNAMSTRWLTHAMEVTDSNAAIFDPSHSFAGCIPGIHEVLRRQGLMQNTFCLDPHEVLSPGQSEELDRVYRAYPHLHDDEFVRENLDHWLS